MRSWETSRPLSRTRGGPLTSHHRWQGYTKSARLFLRMKRPERAAKTVEYVLERVKADNSTRRETLLVLKQVIIEFTAAIKRHIPRTSYHFGNLPIEIPCEMFSLVDSDHAFMLILSVFARRVALTSLPNPNLTTLSMSLIGFVMNLAPSQFAGTTLELQKLRQLDLKSDKQLLTMSYRANMSSLAGLSLSEFTTIGDQLTNFLTRYRWRVSHTPLPRPPSPAHPSVTSITSPSHNYLRRHLGHQWGGRIPEAGYKWRCGDNRRIAYCPLIESEVQDWLGRNVPSFNCVYTREKDTRWKR